MATLIDGIASAIAQMEGYNVPNSIAQRNNNPGNLRSGVGMTGTAGGYAVFPDAATGFAALQNQITLNINRGLTLNEFFAGKPGVYGGYAPSADSNNPVRYAAFVAGQTGVDVNTPLSSYLTDSGASGSGAIVPDVAPPLPFSDLNTDSTATATTSGLDTVTLLYLAAAGVLLFLFFRE